jgi:hypothetical protein
MIKHPMCVFNQPMSVGSLHGNLNPTHDLECLDAAEDDECIEPKEKSVNVVYTERRVGGRHM